MIIHTLAQDTFVTSNAFLFQKRIIMIVQQQQEEEEAKSKLPLAK
jgi:hypothetical protein